MTTDLFSFSFTRIDESNSCRTILLVNVNRGDRQTWTDSTNRSMSRVHSDFRREKYDVRAIERPDEKSRPVSIGCSISMVKWKTTSPTIGESLLFRTSHSSDEPTTTFSSNFQSTLADRFPLVSRKISSRSASTSVQFHIHFCIESDFDSAPMNKSADWPSTRKMFLRTNRQFRVDRNRSRIRNSIMGSEIHSRLTFEQVLFDFSLIFDLQSKRPSGRCEKVQSTRQSILNIFVSSEQSSSFVPNVNSLLLGLRRMIDWSPRFRIFYNFLVKLKNSNPQLNVRHSRKSSSFHLSTEIPNGCRWQISLADIGSNRIVWLWLDVLLAKVTSKETGARRTLTRDLEFNSQVVHTTDESLSSTEINNVERISVWPSFSRCVSLALSSDHQHCWFVFSLERRSQWTWQCEQSVDLLFAL